MKGLKHQLLLFVPLATDLQNVRVWDYLTFLIVLNSDKSSLESSASSIGSPKSKTSFVRDEGSASFWLLMDVQLCLFRIFYCY